MFVQTREYKINKKKTPTT